LLLLRGECRVLAGDLEAGARDLAAVARSRGAQSGQPDRLRALEWLAFTHFLLGSWQEADSFVDDIEAFGGDTAGQALRAMFVTVRGAGAAPRDTRWAPAYRRTLGSAHPDRLVTATFADVVAMLSARRHGDILSTIDWLTSEAAGLGDAPARFAPLLLPVYVEAAVEAGTRAASEQGLARLRTLAQQVPALAVAAHRLAGRLAEHRQDLVAAEREYEAGLLAAETRAQVPPLHLAQLEFAYGRLLCVLGRTSAGLEWLQAAEDRFAALGALAFVRHCAQDRADVVRGIPAGPEVALTEREVTVAALVASGLTNRQTAAELMISAKAVEYHLRKIYRKLGVSTRSELAGRWPG
jgi:DNA-binding CsgD family transcriptional regulator